MRQDGRCILSDFVTQKNLLTVVAASTNLTMFIPVFAALVFALIVIGHPDEQLPPEEHARALARRAATVSGLQRALSSCVQEPAHQLLSARGASRRLQKAKCLNHGHHTVSERMY